MTAVAILSIVIGGFGLLGAISSVVSTAVMMTVTPPVPPAAPAPATGPAAAPPPPIFGYRPTMSMVVLGVVDGVVRGGLAALLVAAGIFVLRDRRLSRRLHLIWAWLRIPLALLSAAVYWQTMRQMFATMPAAPGTPIPTAFMDSVMLIGIIVQILIAWAYPVAVLIVMRTQTARAYYKTLTE
jgi:hypothetical protein